MSIVSKTRSEFCADYLKQKQAVFLRLEREVLDQTQRDGEIITCHRGCAYCCYVYVEATPKECEAVVYHLYQNEEVLISFLRQYPDWLRKTRQLGDRCTEAIRVVRKQGRSEAAHRELADALLFYKLQNIACPFLNEGSCTIYSARPLACAAHFATTPLEWCSPLDSRNPKIYKGSFAGELADVSLYHEQPGDPGAVMPVKVYEIIHKDRASLSQIPGLPDVEHEAMNDARIAAILRTYT